ncbi:hypothetical protein GCM10010381_63570 [Streptomyces xantholiticus]|nr:hypothetical protein GCM10010381_63570 [Streptomyces xantholiticus]
MALTSTRGRATTAPRRPEQHGTSFVGRVHISAVISAAALRVGIDAGAVTLDGHYGGAQVVERVAEAFVPVFPKTRQPPHPYDAMAPQEGRTCCCALTPSRLSSHPDTPRPLSPFPYAPA